MTDAIPGLRSFWRAVAPGFTPRSGARALSAAGEFAPELAGSYAGAIVVIGSREIRLKRSSASAASFINLVRIVAAAALAAPNRTALIDILQRHRHRAIRYERNGPKQAHLYPEGGLRVATVPTQVFSELLQDRWHLLQRFNRHLPWRKVLAK
jgi:hypothetical protein